MHDIDEWVSIFGQGVSRALSHEISRIAGGTRLRFCAFGAKLKPSESKRQVSSKTKQREQLYTIHFTQFSAVSRIEFAFSHNSDPQKSSDHSTLVQKSELQILDVVSIG